MSHRSRVAALLLAGLLPLGACASTRLAEADSSDWELVDASEGYPLSTCPISGNQLDDDRIAIRYQGEEVQLHCESDLEAFLVRPGPALEKVRAARAR